MGGEGLSPGDRIGSYVVQSRLGSGGMADVYLVRHDGLDKLFAMKVFRRPDHARAEELAARFVLEMKTVATLDHPNIVTATDSGTVGGEPWFTMTYIEGMDGSDAVQKRYPNGLPPTQVVTILNGVGDALDYAHGRGLIHRDVKPGNIMIGTNGRAYLTDFGIVKALSDPNPITTESPPKTLAYASPEQQLDRPLSPRSDIYSLGGTMFFLLTGQTPYQGDPLAQANQHLNSPPPQPSRIAPDLPQSLDVVVAKAMAREPDGRYQTGKALADATRDALRSRLEPTQPTAGPAVTSPNSHHSPRRIESHSSRRRWTAIGAIALVLVAGGIWSMLRSTGSDQVEGSASSTASVSVTSASLAGDNGGALAGAATTGVAAQPAVVPLDDLLDPELPVRSGRSADEPLTSAAFTLGPRTCANGTQTVEVDVGSGLARITGTLLMSDDAPASTRTQVTVITDGAAGTPQIVAPRNGVTIQAQVTGASKVAIELATAGSGTCGSDDYQVFLTNAQAFR